MIEKVKLVESTEDSVWRGNILSLPAKYPYEDFVDFMVFETKDRDRPYGLIVTSGYKAGLVLVHLPAESSALGRGVDRIWLVSNWNTWIYPDSDVSSVYLIDGYRSACLF